MFDPFDNMMPIFTPDPVVRNHPLNRGRVAWWICVPGLDGGRQWIDLMGLYHGTLTNMTTAASGWRGTTRPGGWGCLSFDGVDDYVLTPTSSASVTGANPRTFACWFLQRTRTSGVNSALYDQYKGAGAQGWTVQLASVSGTTYLWTDSTAQNIAISGAQIPSLGVWHHLAFTMTAAVAGAFTWTYYLDGALVTSGTISSINTPANAAYLGARQSAAIGYADLLMDSASVWSRDLFAAEIRAEFRLGPLGYPGLLRRWPQAAMTAAAAPPPPPGTSGKPVRWFPGLARPIRPRPRLRAR